MEPQPDEMRREIEETRSSLTEKIGALGDRITETVASTTSSVEETVENVRESVNETVDTVKHAFDVRYQVRRHPCAMFFGAVGLGFALQKLLTPRAMHVIRHKVEDAVDYAAKKVSAGASYVGHKAADKAKEAGERLAEAAGSRLASSFAGSGSSGTSGGPGYFEKVLRGPLHELDQLKELGIEAGKAFVKTLAIESLPPLAIQAAQAAGLLDESDVRHVTSNGTGSDRTTLEDRPVGGARHNGF